MKIYIAGKVTGEDAFRCGLKFGYRSSKLREEGHKVINPFAIFSSLSTAGFSHEDIMHLCYAAIDVCDAVYMLEDWPGSKGARMEHEYALKIGKTVIYQFVQN